MNGHTSNGTLEVSEPSNNAVPLRIVIAGAGIGGLTAACFLRQQGHKVTLLEKSRFANELGAAVHLAPNANGLLRRLGIYAEDFGANSMDRMTNYNPQSEIQKEIDTRGMKQMWQHPWLLAHRVHLHNALKTTATSTDGKGEPAILRTSSKVVDFDPATGTVVLENGETVEGDVVIGADGVHSRSRELIDPNIKPKSSGQNAFRFMIPKKTALEDPRTERFAKADGNLALWYGRDRRVVMYPCQNNELLNFVALHPTAESAKVDHGQEYTTQAHISKLQEVYRDFDDDLIALLSKADVKTLNVWELWDMDQLPTWVNGKLALLGDAAHPFTPHQGQGAGQAMEDAASLAVVLPLGTRPEDVAERLKLYEQFRSTRAHKIQDFSRLAGRDLVGPVDMMAFTNYNFGHDEWDNSTNLFRRWEWSRKPNLYWRMPVSFGPMPGPRQRFDGSARSSKNSTFVTASFKFKTSRTLLQNLLPSPSFKFKSPGTTAYASFSQTTLNGMEWLGGTGYRHFGLYIHGVQYVQKSGEVLNGTYMPVLFENLADPILSGREELGMPKLFCSLDVWRRSTSYRLQAGWQGVPFADFAIEGLEEVASATEGDTTGGETDDGLLLYKFIPKTGSLSSKERGQAEVEHAVFVPHAEESQVVPSKVTRVLTAKSASIKFDTRDWEALPTLHHVVSRLAEIPVYGIVSAKVVEGHGVADVSSARRID